MAADKKKEQLDRVVSLVRMEGLVDRFPHQLSGGQKQWVALAFAFLVILAQLARYDWRMDEAAMVFGARPMRTFWEITLPTIWPSVFGAFLISFILAFNNLEISFYNLGAIPTLPTIAWGTLRHGIEPELYALASVINFLVFIILITLFFLIRLGFVRLGYREQ